MSVCFSCSPLSFYLSGRDLILLKYGHEWAASLLLFRETSLGFPEPNERVVDCHFKYDIASPFQRQFRNFLNEACEPFLRHPGGA